MGNWTRNSHWNEALCQIFDLNKFAEFIDKSTKDSAKDYKHKKLKSDEDRLNDEDYLERRQHITLTRHENNPAKIYIDSNEVFIERLLTFIANDCQNGGKVCSKFWNQYQIVKSYKEAVDIRIKNGDKFKYVELKALDTPSNEVKEGKADNPLFAIIESVKNYYLSLNQGKIEELIILAPIDYWNKYLAYKGIYERIQKLICGFKNLDKPIYIKLQFIDCTSIYHLPKFIKEFNKIICDNDFKEKISEVKDILKRRYTHAANYKLKDIYSCLSDYDLKELFRIKDFNSLISCN